MHDIEIPAPSASFFILDSVFFIWLLLILGGLMALALFYFGCLRLKKSSKNKILTLILQRCLFCHRLFSQLGCLRLSRFDIKKRITSYLKNESTLNLNEAQLNQSLKGFASELLKDLEPQKTDYLDLYHQIEKSCYGDIKMNQGHLQNWLKSLEVLP